MSVKSENDLLIIHNVFDEDFTVEWGGQPFTIKAGEDKVYPRFVAEHMAKHMADKALLADEVERSKELAEMGEKLTHSFLNDRVARTAVVDKIIKGVYQYYNETSRPSSQDQLNQQIDQANDLYKKAENIGTVDNDPVLGILADNPPLPTVTDKPDDSAKVSLTGKGKKPTKQQLIDDLKVLGEPLTGAETYSELMEKIKRF